MKQRAYSTSKKPPNWASISAAWWFQLEQEVKSEIQKPQLNLEVYQEHVMQIQGHHIEKEPTCLEIEKNGPRAQGNMNTHIRKATSTGRWPKTQNWKEPLPFIKKTDSLLWANARGSWTVALSIDRKLWAGKTKCSQPIMHNIKFQFQPVPNGPCSCFSPCSPRGPSVARSRWVIRGPWGERRFKSWGTRESGFWGRFDSADHGKTFARVSSL